LNPLDDIPHGNTYFNHKVVVFSSKMAPKKDTTAQDDPLERAEAAKEKGFLDPFQAADLIDDKEVSWTMGRMLLYAAGQVPPQTTEYLPVGFGSNVAGVPSDFQYAGSSWNTTWGSSDDDDWIDTAEDFIDHAKSKSSSGFLFFLLVLFLLALLFRKRDRRMRLYNKINSILRPHRKPGSPRKGGRGFSSITNKLFRRSHHYERVLEEGDVAQFELGDVSSDEGEHSDSSGGSRSRFGRSSGLATPKVNLESFDDLKKPAHPGSALDRSGLVVRTESRERLVPQMLGAGRRSRAGSPARNKSPLVNEER